mmetsp:Transcript_4773/g.8859  ORF Transcript_4773/g.8859 Transcript_4773/m.8859 type:complete len:438 (-) Transcript_4773:344-1657(-)
MKTFFLILLAVTASSSIDAAVELPSLPIGSDDFGEPDWMAIIERAFPPWEIDGPCGSLVSVGGEVDVPMPSRIDGDGNPIDDQDDTTSKVSRQAGGKWNPCYYTKRFAGLDPSFGGYPTPIDTRYPYEYAAPFFGQPGDGSTHHCPIGSPPDINIADCPKVNTPCPDGKNDCVVIGEYGIGHIPPFVALAAVKNEYLDALANGKDICSKWFDYKSYRCDIKKNMLDELVYKYFGVDNTIQFEPPIVKEDGTPSSTYYKLEFAGESPACDDGNCYGPHYCSTEVTNDGSVWGDYCPYVHTGENAGKYRHPHIALAALQQLVANACMPSLCGKEWDEGPDGYPPKPTESTSITWCEMEDNEDPISQPKVPYSWPIMETDESILPGPFSYGAFKPAKGFYVNELVLQGDNKEKPCEDSGATAMNVANVMVASAAAVLFVL